MAGKAKIKMGGVKWVSSPMSEWRRKGLPHQCEMLPTYREEPKLTTEERLYTHRMAKETILTVKLNQQGTRSCS